MTKTANTNKNMETTCENSGVYKDLHYEDGAFSHTVGPPSRRPLTVPPTTAKSSETLLTVPVCQSQIRLIETTWMMTANQDPHYT
jgi:hypothetical protein